MKKLQFNPNIGPKIVTVGKMAIDLLFFMFLLAVIGNVVVVRCTTGVVVTIATVALL